MKSTKIDKSRNSNLEVLFLIFILMFVAIMGQYVVGQPTGATIVYNTTDQIAAVPASSLATAGGSFTTLVLNGTFQTQKWKAYVGNVTGILSLDDATQNTIYDWSLVTISGEVYVTRNDSVDWSTIGCAQDSTIATEQTFLNINANSVDSINNTFNESVHQEFYVGTTQILASNCKAIATYINDSKQVSDENANFQEVLLEDVDGNAVFASIIEDALLGYNEGAFDFQLIVPEDETTSVPNEYYFYVEIS